MGLYVDKTDFFDGAANGKTLKKSNVISYYDNMEELWEEYLNSVKRAKKEVFIFAYILKQGERLTALCDVLFELLKRGVKVNVGGDWFGSGPFYSDGVFKCLKNAGAKLSCFREPKLLLVPWDNVRAHAKITIIDEEELFITSANVDDKSLGLDKNYGVKIVGNMGKARDVFAPLWGREIGAAEYDFGNVKLFLTRTRDQIKEVFVSLISQSEKTVDIVTPYLSFDEEVGDLLERCIKKKVRVRVFVPKYNEKDKTDVVSSVFLSELLDRGVEVFRYCRGFLHSKILIIDGELLMLGSANFDLRSSSFAVESLAFFCDNRLIDRVFDDLNGILNNSERQKRVKNTRIKRLTRKIVSVFGPLV